MESGPFIAQKQFFLQHPESIASNSKKTPKDYPITVI